MYYRVLAAGKTRKLKQLRNKRNNVSIYQLYTDGYIIAIGNTKFKQTIGNSISSLRINHEAPRREEHVATAVGVD